MTSREARRSPTLPIALAVVSCSLLAGCGDEIAGLSSDAGDPRLGSAIEMLAAGNGMSQNGMSQNGMSQNGMSQNGMSQNGFGTTAFRSWFNTNPQLGDMVMKYLAICAAPAGTSYGWTNPSTGITYTWAGSMGLAPGFAAGAAPTTAEQQVLTACLAAHVNKYGVQVPIAIEGRTATGVQIPIGVGELTTYSVREACFFGNVFSGQGVFVASDHSNWSSAYTTARACGFYSSTATVDTDCPPIARTDTCKKLCTSDASGTFYESCTWNGKTYKPLTTRLRPQEIYRCGDGVCQFTESCGSGGSWDNCKADCGVCP
jgi:hypothetical protein